MASRTLLIRRLAAAGLWGVVLTGLAACQEVSAPGAIAQPILADGDTLSCEPNPQVLSQGGQYRANVDLTASRVLPGEKGVDVVMSPWGAIAAVNRDGESGTGALLHWVNPATGELIQTVPLAEEIRDLAFAGGERPSLVVAAGDEVLRLDPASGAVVSRLPLAGVKRVAVAAEGTIAAIAGPSVYLFDAENRQIFAKERDDTEITDVEVLACGSQEERVYVTSFRNATFTDQKGKRNPVQIARLEALDFSGERQWTLFGDSAETIRQNVADTRLYRVSLGRDGYLYIAGESAGTATIFRWRGQPMTDEEQRGRTEPFMTRIDDYSRLHNSGAAHLSYYARVNPATGELITAQMSFPRRENKKANAMRLGDIAVGADGQLFFGGSAGASIYNRENLTLNGESVGGYVGSDRVWMAVAPNFEVRNFWTVLAAEPGKGRVIGVDVGYGYSAALSNVKSGTVPVTTGEPKGEVYLTFIAQ